MTLDHQELAWYKRIATFHHSHYSCSRKYRNRHYTFGLPSVVLATASGTTIFASLESSASEQWGIVAGVLALLSAILAAIVTFLNYKERSDKHHKAGGLYGILRTNIEWYAQYGDPLLRKDFWEKIIEDMNNYDIECPVVPKADYDKSRAFIDKLDLKHLTN